MIHLNSKLKIIERESELPDFTRCKDLFLDLETENNTEHLHDGAFKEYSGFSPFHGDKIGSFSVTADDCDEVYYVPMRHTDGNNMDVGTCLRWLQSHLSSVKRWINHNIKFDALFCFCENIDIKCEMIDTLTMSKVHDSDRLNHALKPLCREWLGIPMEEELKLKVLLKSLRTRNFMRAPIDILGEYANMDVFGNRALYRFLLAKRPEELKPIWEMEIKLGHVLFDMETEGIKVNKTVLMTEMEKAYLNTMLLQDRLSTLCDREFVDSNQCIGDILLNQLGLPVVKTIKERQAGGQKKDTGRPTFDKDALLLYQIHPKVVNNPKAKEIVDTILEYRTEAQFLSLYCTPFTLLKDENDKIHPRYNPVVRTGRMSCSMPNIQQQNKRSKHLIMPDEGYGFISNDYSQVEFRLIAHYIKDQEAIRAYNEDPNTDFHKWVQELIGTTDRTAAKTVNFGSAYGQGKLGVTTELAGNPDVIKDINQELDELVRTGKIHINKKSQMFETMCRKRAIALYDTYHARLPGIKEKSKIAASTCRARGYVRTAYGRRRHLMKRFSHRAFNSCIQGSAMDIIKEAMIKLSPRYNEVSRKYGLKVTINVHDEIVSKVPEDELLNPELHRHIIETLEAPSVSLSVPIKVGLGVSTESWYEAAGDDFIKNGSGEIVAGRVI